MSWDILPKAKLQYLLTRLKEVFDNKVDKETGKGLSTNDYTTTEKNKLAGIATGAEVNVQSDWNQTTTTADDFIKNKPTITNTTYTIATGDNNGQIKVTPSSGSAYNVAVKGLGSAAYYNQDTSASNNTVVRRDGNGYIYGKYFNSNIGDEDINSYTSNPAVVFTSNDKWIRRTNKSNFLRWLGLGANVSRIQISSYLSSDKTLYPPTSAVQWDNYFYTTTATAIQGTYLVMISTWMKDNTGGSPKFRALINSVATAEFICSGTGLIGFTYFGIVTISTLGSLTACLQGTSNNASSCKIPAYFTHQLVLIKIDGTF